MKCLPVFGERIYLALRSSDAADLSNAGYVRFSASWEMDAFSFRHVCPKSLAAVMHFNDLLTQKLGEADCEKVVCCVESAEPAKILQAKFLLGSYLVLKENLSPAEAWVCLNTYHPLVDNTESSKDAGASDFPKPEQEIFDSWAALALSNQLGWIRSFDLAEVLHYNRPFEGDLHWIVPDKLLAMRCPTIMPSPDVLYFDIETRRYFSPEFYVEPFQDMNVGCVVSLNDYEVSSYTPTVFENVGLRCVALDFEEEAARPPIHTILDFLEEMDQAGDSAVVVHCRTGLIQTAVMIIVYLMREFGFSAATAVAWLRLTRPGSVAPQHEEFLRSMDVRGADEDAAEALGAALLPLSRREESFGQLAEPEADEHCEGPISPSMAPRRSYTGRLRPESCYDYYPEAPVPGAVDEALVASEPYSELAGEEEWADCESYCESCECSPKVRPASPLSLPGSPCLWTLSLDSDTAHPLAAPLDVAFDFQLGLNTGSPTPTTPTGQRHARSLRVRPESAYDESDLDSAAGTPTLKTHTRWATPSMMPRPASKSNLAAPGEPGSPWMLSLDADAAPIDCALGLGVSLNARSAPSAHCLRIR